MATSPSHSKPNWHYAICRHCDAKWFAPFRPLRCPRCGQRVRHAVTQEPPWLHKKTHTRRPSDDIPSRDKQEPGGL